MESDVIEEKTRTREKLVAKDYAEILDLNARGLNHSQIGGALGIKMRSVQSVLRNFRGVFKEIDNVPNYRTVKADLLSAAQLTVLKSAMSESKLRKASFITCMQGFKILNEAERLENNQSTANIAHGFGKLQLSAGIDDK